MLVSEYIEGERFEAVRRPRSAQRDRYGEIVFRFFFGLLYRDRIALGDPHPGNYLLRPDGRVCFLDFGLLRDVDAARVDGERGDRAAPSATGDAAALKSALVAGAYLPASRADAVDAELRAEADAAGEQVVRGARRASLLGRAAAARDRERRPAGRRAARPRSETQVNQFTVPPEAILIRRMHGIVAIVLSQLRAGADWGAIAAEYLHGDAAGDAARRRPRPSSSRGAVGRAGSELQRKPTVHVATAMRDSWAARRWTCSSPPSTSPRS